MAFEDALTDVATISSLSKTVENTGEEVISLEEEYEDEPCRLLKGGYGAPKATQVPGQFEDPRDQWTMLLKPTVIGVQKSWRVSCNGLDFVVTSVHEVRGDTSAVHHVVLFLQEKK